MKRFIGLLNPLQRNITTWPIVKFRFWWQISWQLRFICLLMIVVATSCGSSSAAGTSTNNGRSVTRSRSSRQSLNSAPPTNNGGSHTPSPTTRPAEAGVDPEGRQFTPSETVTFESPWTWQCVDDISCYRQLSNSTPTNRVSLPICWLTCGPYGPLWPIPTVKTFLSRNTIMFYPGNVEITHIYAPHPSVKAMLGFAGNALLDTLFRMHPKSEGNSVFPTNSGGLGIEKNIVTISLTAQTTDTRIGLTTDESYSVTIAPYYEGQGRRLHIEVNGATYFGVRHGLETLGQLVAFDEVHECLQMVSQATIHDQPTFRYRGLMIDTSRNFIPVKHLKKMVDGMAQNKLNVLHWHMTDSNSFPFYSKSVPQMTKYGAYSEAEIYSPKQIRELILYGRLRGVKILPELDAPAHAGNGWQWGPLEGLGDLALCVNAEPWRQHCGQPPCGQLHPLNQFTYIVLGEIYKDMLDLFDGDLFHMGGDEIYFQCWYNNPEVQSWQRNRSTFDLMDLWGHFQQTAFKKLREANGGRYVTPIVWTSDMTARGRVHLSPSDYIIQVWTNGMSTEVKDLLTERYRLIFSNLDSTYLDHGFGTWLGRDHLWQIKTWQDLYDNDISKIVEYHLGANYSREVLRSGQILGGEAPLWSEKVDEHNLEMKLWPRSAAFAERLWTNPPNRSESVYPRLLHHRNRMVHRGIHADRIQPESCHQITGFCFDPFSVI